MPLIPQPEVAWPRRPVVCICWELRLGTTAIAATSAKPLPFSAQTPEHATRLLWYIMAPTYYHTLAEMPVSPQPEVAQPWRLVAYIWNLRVDISDTSATLLGNRFRLRAED